MAVNQHIKRDGAWLCKKDVGHSKKYWRLQNTSHITFKEAHTADLGGHFFNKHTKHYVFCQDCVKRYYEILDGFDYVIVIDEN